MEWPTQVEGTTFVFSIIYKGIPLVFGQVICKGISNYSNFDLSLNILVNIGIKSIKKQLNGTCRSPTRDLRVFSTTLLVIWVLNTSMFRFSFTFLIDVNIALLYLTFHVLTFVT